jgi:hypothetical protein
LKYKAGDLQTYRNGKKSLVSLETVKPPICYHAGQPLSGKIDYVHCENLSYGHHTLSYESVIKVGMIKAIQLSSEMNHSTVYLPTGLNHGKWS